LISQVTGQVSSQWQGFNVVDEGETAIARLKASYAVGVGKNPKGVPSVFKITAAGTGAEALVVIASAPQSEYAAVKAGLAQIERSLALGAAPAGAPSAAAEKLAALDAACKAGVFSPAECEAKRKSLLGPAPAPSALAQGKLTATPPSPSRPQAALQGAVRLTRLSVRDPGVDNIEAVSFLIPAGWKAEGGIQWFRDYRILACLLMQITDPQSGAAIEFLPLQLFNYGQMIVPMPPGTNYLGSVIWPPVTDIPQFIQGFYFSDKLARLRNAKVVATQDLPEVASLVAQSSGAQTAKSARVRYEYDAGSQSWEEDVYTTLSYTQVSNRVYWGVEHAYSFRAPKGLLDRMTPLMSTVIATRRLSLDWYAAYMYVGQLFDDRLRRGIRAAGELSRTITRNTEEIRQMFAESYRQRSESEDRISRRFSEYIRGVDTYRNPYEDRPVQLPSGYSNVWVNRSGEYILSDQAGFNPNVGSNVEWRQIERAR
jgi:hypothetical protein